MVIDAQTNQADDRFSITRLFDGRTRAWGIVEDRFGRLRRRLAVEMTGAWQGDRFRLDETFRYDDGRQERRTWFIVPAPDGRFTARCDDCVGEASGESVGGGIHMTYRFRLRLARRSLVVDFSDRIYDMGGGQAINRASIRKWGIKIAELSLFFQRETSREASERPLQDAAAA